MYAVICILLRRISISQLVLAVVVHGPLLLYLANQIAGEKPRTRTRREDHYDSLLGSCFCIPADAFLDITD
jgi:hypothetical protein